MLSPTELAGNSRCPPQPWQAPLIKSSPSSTRSRGRSGSGTAGWRRSLVSILSGAASTFGAVAVGGTLFRAMSDAGGTTGGIRTAGVETDSIARCGASGGVATFRSSRAATWAGASGWGRLSRCSSRFRCAANWASSWASRVCRCFNRSSSDRSCSFMIGSFLRPPSGGFSPTSAITSQRTSPLWREAGRLADWLFGHSHARNGIPSIALPRLRARRQACQPKLAVSKCAVPDDLFSCRNLSAVAGESVNR